LKNNLKLARAALAFTAFLFVGMICYSGFLRMKEVKAQTVASSVQSSDQDTEQERTASHGYKPSNLFILSDGTITKCSTVEYMNNDSIMLFDCDIEEAYHCHSGVCEILERIKP
jgi:hypothetical protein